MAETDFLRKILFRSKAENMPEICRKSPFLQIFIGLFPNICLFFSQKNVINNNANHQAWLNCQLN